MQGIWVHNRRPVSKKQVKEVVATDPESVYLEATSIFGNEYDGPITQMPENKMVSVVGPDPSTKRNFYLNIVRVGNTFKVT